MLVRATIAIAALLVVLTAVLSGTWWTLAAVGAVLFGAFFWRPRVRALLGARGDRDGARRATSPARNMLGVLTIAAVVVQRWALDRAVDDDSVLGTAILAAVSGSCLAIWALAAELRRRG